MNALRNTIPMERQEKVGGGRKVQCRSCLWEVGREGEEGYRIELEKVETCVLGEFHEGVEGFKGRIVPYENPSSAPPTPLKPESKSTPALHAAKDVKQTPTLSLKQRVEMLENFIVVQNKRLEGLEKKSTLQDTSTFPAGEPTPPPPKKFIPKPFPYHHILEARCEALTNLGVGVCRVSLPDDYVSESLQNVEEADEESYTKGKWVVFVPSVIPGELVKCRVYRNYKGHSDADLLEVIERSENRVEPKCRIAGECGGCQYQHIDVGYQRVWKRQHVVELLTKIGGIDSSTAEATVKDTVGTDEVFHYRSKLTPHYDAPRDRSEIDVIGFQRKQIRQLIDVPECVIATKEINEALPGVRERVNQRLEMGELKKKKGATLLLRHADEGVVFDHNQYVTTTVKDIKFRFKAGNFFQNNPYMLPSMVNYVVGQAKGGIGENGDGDMTHLVDCYCGSGLFCLSASKDFEVCVGIEVNDKAVEEARENAALNGVENCEFVAASAEQIFYGGQVQTYPKDKTCVVIDPPRKGASEEFLEQLLKFGPMRIVYMSCGPDTQARDTKILLASGAYELREVVPFDLFPQTRHIESCAVFERVN
ncbi:hypothetical protein TrST_g5683 [Triparma strigata]|uniref:Uncharacterized protein n=1 Tax=Triparma strigata TaxID=1606541 RepID=A0A9W6ZKV2_9STRA|nr:hypothetical protein TrST_g5683 [Triparma strigata]